MNPYEAPAAVPGVAMPPTETAAIPTFSKTYTVTPSMLLSSSSQFFFAVALGWRWLGLLFVAGSSVLCLLLDFPTIAAIALAVTLLMAVMWVKAYFQYRNQAQTQIQLWGNTQVTIEFSETGIIVSTSRGNSVFTWNELNRLKESKDFVFILRDKLPLMSLPKSELSSDAITLLHTLVRGSH